MIPIVPRAEWELILEIPVYESKKDSTKSPQANEFDRLRSIVDNSNQITVSQYHLNVSLPPNNRAIIAPIFAPRAEVAELKEYYTLDTYVNTVEIWETVEGFL